ncbi:MAG TPA: serine/threonine-protein kinase, partial [Polyangia bacterium]|nr:serine/threonine-protein kinase [Polyangia bacterium]
KPLGIVHRDVSPHNVMMSAEGEVKLTDFGIAKAQNKTEKSLGNLIKGKVAFMSPEQAAGGELDGRSDLFSVGTMLYTMITRRHPFDAPTDYETLMLVKNGDFLPPETARPGLNPELYRVIRKAMGKTADARYQKAEEMLVDVEQVMRVAFRPVGQTELQRWLADLSTKDGVPPLTREAPPEPPASRSTVGPLRAGSGQESGLVLTLDDAEEVRASDRPPPPPPAGATEVMTHPPQFAIPDRAWHRRPAVRIAGAGALLLLGAVVWARVLNGHRPGDAPPPSPVVAAESKASAPTPAPPTPSPTPTVVQPAAATATPPPPTATAAATDAQAAPPPAPSGVAAAKPEPAGAAGTTGTAPEEKAPPPTEADQADAPPTESGSHPPKEQAPGKAPQVPVVIKSDPEGSHVATGHHQFGTTPLTLKLRPGNSYDLTFSRSGYAPVTRHYKPDGHGPQTLRVSLKKIPEAKKAPAPVVAPKPAPPPPKKFFSR